MGWNSGASRGRCEGRRTADGDGSGTGGASVNRPKQRATSASQGEQTLRNRRVKAAQPSADKADEPRGGTQSHRPTKCSKGFLDHHERSFLAGVTALALVVRAANLSFPASIVWDESHFTQFTRHYFKGTYYFDVHPPLGKLLYALAAYLFAGGIGSSADLSAIGTEFDSTVPFVGMRAVAVFFGTALVPAVYYICRELDLGIVGSLLAAACVTLDNAFVLISRYILLDAPLLFFCFFSILCALKLRRTTTPTEKYSWEWFLWLVALGISLGCAASVKMVGLFTVFYVAILTFNDLWQEWRNRALPLSVPCVQFAVRATVLVLLPVSVFVGLLVLHVHLLPQPGPGDAFMDAGFMGRGITSGAYDNFTVMPLYITSGSRIMLKHHEVEECWLHAHPYRYPPYPRGEGSGSKSSQLQQATCLGNRYDGSNEFEIIILNSTEHFSDTQLIDGTHFLQHGDVVVLRHIPTQCHLTSDYVDAPVSHDAREIACFTQQDFESHSAAYDTWLVQVLGDPNPLVRARSTHFRLVHGETGNNLEVSGEQLPEWGFYQGEVVGRPITDARAAMWVIDFHFNPAQEQNLQLSPSPAGNGSESMNPHSMLFATTHVGAMSYAESLLHLVYKMITANSLVTQQHASASRPFVWPLFADGIPFWRQVEPTSAQIVFLGNFFVWAPAFASLIVACLIVLSYALLEKRNFIEQTKETLRFRSQVATLVCGWLVHYVPFFFMKRQLFMHHYLPAIVFTVCLYGCTCEHILGLLVRQFSAAPRDAETRTIIMWVKLAVLALLLLPVGGFFAFFVPITYGLELEPSDIEKRQWFDWDIHAFKER